MKKEIIIGFVLGMFALLIFSFTFFIRKRIQFNRELQEQRLELIDKARSVMNKDVKNLVITEKGTLIINYNKEFSPDFQSWLLK